jgi:hypothetical protein
MQVLLMMVHAYEYLNYVSQRRGMAVHVLDPTGGRMVVSLGQMHHHRRQEPLQLTNLILEAGTCYIRGCY